MFRHLLNQTKNKLSTKTEPNSAQFLNISLMAKLKTFQNTNLVHNSFNLQQYIQVSQEECARLREGVPYVKVRVYRYNLKHLCANLNGFGDNGQRILKF